MSSGFRDAALVLLGHGTTLNSESAAPVYQHAKELRNRGEFKEVREGFWKQPPQVKDVLSEIRTRRIFIVPIFISEGYFSEQIIPLELGFRKPDETDWSRRLVRADQLWFYCNPVGTHPKMQEVLLRRASEVVQNNPFPRPPQSRDTTLFIAGHGTEQNENSRKIIENQAESIRSLDVYAAVHAIFMEEEPQIGNCYELAQTRNVVIVPFFVSDGLNTREDIPVMLGEPERLVRQRLQAGQPTWRNPTEKKGKLVWYSNSVGSEPCLVDVILERVKEQSEG